MKKIFFSRALLLASAMAALFAGNAFAQKKSAKGAAGSYAGQYDESMTPENSCVIFFTMPGCNESEFKQINPNLDVDEQQFKYEFSDMQSVTIFKPVKPGSRYMLSKMSGQLLGGTVREYFNYNLKPNQQYLVIDVPKEPGIYTYGMFFIRDVAKNMETGVPCEVPEADKYTWEGKPVVKGFYKGAQKKFKKLYNGTPWMAAFGEKFKSLPDD